MASFICYHEGKFNIYSTVSDAFTFDSGLTLEELEEFYQEGYGNKGLREIAPRLERAVTNGTSIRFGETGLEGMLDCNRAGAEGENLSFQECIDQFLT